MGFELKKRENRPLLEHEIITLKKQLRLIADIHKNYILKDFESEAEEMEYLRVHLSSGSFIAEQTLLGVQ